MKLKILKFSSQDGVILPALKRRIRNKPKTEAKRKKIQLVLRYGFIKKTRVPIKK